MNSFNAFAWTLARITVLSSLIGAFTACRTPESGSALQGTETVTNAAPEIMTFTGYYQKNDVLGGEFIKMTLPSIISINFESDEAKAKVINSHGLTDYKAYLKTPTSDKFTIIDATPVNLPDPILCNVVSGVDKAGQSIQSLPKDLLTIKNTTKAKGPNLGDKRGLVLDGRQPGSLAFDFGVSAEGSPNFALFELQRGDLLDLNTGAQVQVKGTYMVGPGISELSIYTVQCVASAAL